MFKRFFLSIILHVFVLTVIIVGLSQHAMMPIVNKSDHIVHATAVKNTTIQAQINKIKREEEAKRQAEIARKKAILEAKRKKEEAVQRQKALAAKKAEEARLAKLKAQKAAKEKALAAKKAAEEKALAEKKAAEEKAKALALREQQAKQQQAALDLQKQIEAERAKVAQEKAQAIQGQDDKYRALVKEAIEQQWLVPPNISEDVSCLLYIHLAPGGVVLDVKLVKSSGDTLLDRSAISAVYKASPLPVPKETDAFAAFRQFNVTVTPEGYIG